MNWLFVALLGQFILGTSAVFDKSLLKRKFFDPLVYTFWLGILGFITFILLPFGFESVSFATIATASISGIVFIFAMMALFYALHKTEASKSLLVIGGFTPVFTLILSYFLLNESIGLIDFLGFLFLVFGGFILLSIEEKGFRKSVVFLTFASAFLFGLSSVLAKLVFEQSSFVTGFICIKISGSVFVLIFLFSSSLRKKISASTGRSNASNRALYLVNRGYGALGSLMIYFAISLAHPALVEATQSLKYVTIFLASWLILREHFKGKVVLVKITATVFIVVGLVWLGLSSYFIEKVDMERDIVWGVTFSKKFSQHLGLDWQKNYEAILIELKPQKIRLVAYWDETEKEKDVFDFSDLDWQINKAGENNVEVILVLGMKVPRWPECHIPEWAKEMDIEERESVLRNYIKNIIERYKEHPSIIMWQIENEPYLLFGICPEREKDFVKKEIDIIKSIDDKRSVIVTDGGEFGLWYKSAKQGDVFGTTMYRKVYSQRIGFLGVYEYPLNPSFFHFKERLVRFLIDDFDKSFIVVELQAEPWAPVDFKELSYEEQLEIFSPEYFRETIEYAKETGFNEYYLWGAEWWYWSKETQNNPDFWEEAKKLF